jgi:hypothetical protein
MLTCELWQAVALSLDIEPNAVPGLTFRPIVGGPFDDCPAQFRRRLEIANNHVEWGAMDRPAYTRDRTREVVRLADFADWAVSLGWELPDPFLNKSVRANRSRRAVPNRSDYELRVANFRTKHGRDPPVQTTKAGILGDREWAVLNGVPRATLAQWRRELLGHQKGGRPKTSFKSSPGIDGGSV